MLYLIESEGGPVFKVTHFPNKEILAKYVKDNPGLSLEDYIVIDGELLQHKGRHIYDGRFQ